MSKDIRSGGLKLETGAIDKISISSDIYSHFDKIIDK